MTNHTIQKTIKNLFPLNRSLTGDGTLSTLKEIRKQIPINIKYFESGTKVFDWKIPLEWTVKRAFIKDSKNNIIVDTKKHPMHLASYSKNINNFFYWKDIKNKFYYIKRKSYLPYRTLYYKKDWGFCVTHKQYEILKKEKEKLKIVIDTSLKKGRMYYGEALVKGRLKKEILLSTYICHPQMANDNLSGIVTLLFLTKFIMKKKRKYSYRILFCPETIGAIAFLKKNIKNINKIYTAVVLTTCGGPGKFSFKESFQKDHEVNHIVKKTFNDMDIKFVQHPFVPLGSDERQFSSHPFRLNSISIFKNKYYEYKYYHTSKDNLDYVTNSNLTLSLKVYKKLISNFEKLDFFKKKINGCEVMLSKHKLFSRVGGQYNNEQDFTSKMLKILFYSDGFHSTSAISKKTLIKESQVLKISNYLKKKKNFK